MDRERYERGRQRLLDVTGERGERTMAGLEAFAPDFCRYIVEFAYGDIYSRGVLDLKQRMIVTVTSLITQGDSAKELSVHLVSALNAGLTRDELMEVMLHCVPYVGFPRVMNAVGLAKQVFADLDAATGGNDLAIAASEEVRRSNAADTDRYTRLADHFLHDSIARFEGIKLLGDKALAQATDDDLFWSPHEESNSIAIIVQHVSGNMKSRWSDFWQSDGEKAGRNRDAEFETQARTREELLELWEQGWGIMFGTLRSLRPDDLERTVTIRGEAHTALQAIHRQVAHYAYHVGQMVHMAKQRRGTSWQTLSIPRKR